MFNLVIELCEHEYNAPAEPRHIGAWIRNVVGNAMRLKISHSSQESAVTASICRPPARCNQGCRMESGFASGRFEVILAALFHVGADRPSHARSGEARRTAPLATFRG